MRRREVLQGAAALLTGRARAGRNPLDCGCGFQMQAAAPAGAFDRVGSRLRVTG